MFEVEMYKTRIELKDPIIVGIFILLYAKNIMLHLSNKFELIEMDTDSLYLGLSEEKFDKISRPEMHPLWYWMMQSECSDNFAADSSSNRVSREQCNNHGTFDKGTPGFSKEEFGEDFLDIDTYISLSIRFTRFFKAETNSIIFLLFKKNVLPEEIYFSKNVIFDVFFVLFFHWVCYEIF